MAKTIINGSLKWILGFILAVGGATIPGVIAYGRLKEKVSQIEININGKADKELVETQLDHIDKALLRIEKKIDAIKDLR